MKSETRLTAQELTTLRTRIKDLEVELTEEKSRGDHLEKTREEFQKAWGNCRSRLEQLECQAAVMRQALDKIGFFCAGENRFHVVSEHCLKALSTDAGKSLLSRLHEAERLLSDLEYLDGVMSFRPKKMGTNAGKAHQERMEEARWLLVHCPNCMDTDQAVLKEWCKRRDTLLEQLKGKE